MSQFETMRDQTMAHVVLAAKTGAISGFSLKDDFAPD
jgi:hypothetical protein